VKFENGICFCLFISPSSRIYSIYSSIDTNEKKSNNDKKNEKKRKASPRRTKADRDADVERHKASLLMFIAHLEQIDILCSNDHFQVRRKIHI
jgi:hypothetical protein